MNDKLLIPSDASHGQIEIIVGAMYLTLADMFQHLAKVEGPAAARAYHDRLLTKIKGGPCRLRCSKTLPPTISL